MRTPSFADQFGARLPRELHDQASRLSWDGFVSAYGRAAGPLSLGRWCCLDADRPAARLGPQGRTYQATIAVRGVSGTCTVAAQGPLAALTTMLHERGITMEILGFHQLRRGAATATFIHGSNGSGEAWAMGVAPDAGRSALEAVIACANRLLTAR